MRFVILLLWLTISLTASAQSFTAVSWLIADASGNTLAGENTQAIRPIASVTKLMTVLVVLDQQHSESILVPIRRVKGISTRIDKKITRMSRAELISLAMISSDNLAAYTLCSTIYESQVENACVDAMNRKAQALGMINTRYVEATGLNPNNVSTAEDLVKLVLASQSYTAIVENSDRSSIKIIVDKKRQTTHSNTNPLVGKYHNTIVSKTGWIRASGGCLVMLVRGETGNRVVIVLGSKNTRTRIAEAEIISQLPDREDQDWIYKYLRIQR